MPKAKATAKDAAIVRGNDEMKKELAEKREALRAMRFNVAGSKGKNVREQRAARKDIARLLTEMNAKAAK